MKPICIIPARGNSKGILKKNLRKIKGKPLISYTIQACLKSKIFSDVIVSTEDKEIAKIAKKFGASVPFMRPKKLAGGYTTIDEVLTHDIFKLLDLGYRFDTFVWRDCTVPFIRIHDIQNAIKLLHKKNVRIVVGVYNQHLNPYYNIVEKTKNGFLQLVKKTYSRPKSRQLSPKVYQMNGLHIYDVNKFLKTKKIVTNFSECIPYIIPPQTGLMIDTEFEFQIAKMIIEKNKNFYKLVR